GRILAGPEEECRISATEAPATAQDPRRPAPQVLTVCSDEDGALTATAFHEGEQLWQSDPSPAGSWAGRMAPGGGRAGGAEAGDGPRAGGWRRGPRPVPRLPGSSSPPSSGRPGPRRGGRACRRPARSRPGSGATARPWSSPTRPGSCSATTPPTARTCGPSP